jgi:YfiH family protein
LSLRSPLLVRHGFRHGFSLRTGGVSSEPFASLNLARGVGDDARAVAENHALLAQDIGYDVARLYEVSQVHGAEVAAVDPALPPERLRQRQADAIFCAPRAGANAAEVAIGVRVADCVAVLLAHPESGAVAAVHAGWRGVVSGVLSATLRALSAHVPGPAGRWIAAVFPHIGVGAFEVGEDVAQQIAACLPKEPNVVVRGGAKPHVDLGRAVVAQLTHAGLSAENVERVIGCTFREPARFFSYRRDGAASGRHLAVIVSRC